MIAWALSLYICTGSSFLNMGPGCHWEKWAGPPFARHTACYEQFKTLADADNHKSIRTYRCLPIWAASGQPVHDDPN